MLAGIDGEAVHRGKCSRLRIEVHDLEGRADGRNKTVDQTDIQRPVQACGGWVQLVELGPSSGSANGNVKSAGRSLCIGACVGKDPRLSRGVAGSNYAARLEAACDGSLS